MLTRAFMRCNCGKVHITTFISTISVCVCGRDLFAQYMLAIGVHNYGKRTRTMRQAMAIASGTDKHATIPDDMSNGRAESEIAKAIDAPIFTVLIWDDQLQSFA